jgi:hypothetical protein
VTRAEPFEIRGFQGRFTQLFEQLVVDGHAWVSELESALFYQPRAPSDVRWGETPGREPGHENSVSEGLDRSALAAGVYCGVPFTALLPVATLAGAVLRLRERARLEAPLQNSSVRLEVDSREPGEHAEGDAISPSEPGCCGFFAR